MNSSLNLRAISNCHKTLIMSRAVTDGKKPGRRLTEATKKSLNLVKQFSQRSRPTKMSFNEHNLCSGIVNGQNYLRYSLEL